MNIYADAWLAWLHFILIFLLLAALVGELILCRPPMSTDVIRRLRRLDLLYGLSALSLLIVGLARAGHFGKSWAFYSIQPWFWLKLACFGVVGLLSIYPTVVFLRWGRQSKSAGDPSVDAAGIKKVRLFIHLELALLPVIVFAAVMMARGL